MIRSASMIQKRLDKRDMTLDRATLKQSKTRCGRGLITDPIAHFVTDVNADLFIKLAVWRGIH